jgi:hypothetical protein
MKEMRNTNKISLGNLEENRPFGRPRRRWEYNIEINLRE